MKFRIKNSMKILFSAIILGLSSPMVQAQLDYLLYGISLSTGEVLEINKSTGATTSLMNLGFVPDVKHGFDYDPSSGVLCVTRPQSGSRNHQRVRINLANKLTTYYGSPGHNESTEGLGFSSDGNAFIFDDRPYPGRGVLESMNYSQNTSAQIMEYTGGQLLEVTGGDHEESTSTFWAADSYFHRLYGLNTITGAVRSQSPEFTGTCCDVDVTATGEVLVSINEAGTTQIRRLDRATGQLVPFITTALSASIKIASVPYIHDRDGDGLGDDVETNTGVFQALGDTGTNPDNPDTDGDGLPDGREVNTLGSNPLLRDSDEDGFDDGFEVSTGFSPLIATSKPDTWSSIHTAAEFRFASQSGQTYKVEASNDLATWDIIESGIAGTGSYVQRFYSIQGSERRFFRATKE